MNITMALGTSIMAFVLGVLIGTSLGYLIWADKNLSEIPQSDVLKKDSPTKQKRRGKNEPK